MVSPQVVEEQLKRLNFNIHAWGRTEVSELPNILLPDEEIYECVNGIYEGGFALLVATDVRLILIDKKPLKFLTVEDLRFDMINEIDYSHRLIGAQINISTGAKVLKFRSYNQPRLRKLINHVQHSMADIKRKQSSHQDGQTQHLEKINEQLQAYLLAQYQNQQELNNRLQQAQQQGISVAPLQTEEIKPSPELADYLFAQSLLRESGQQLPQQPVQPQQISTAPRAQTSAQPSQQFTSNDLDEMYDEGRREVFGKQMAEPAAQAPLSSTADQPASQAGASVTSWIANYNPLEINPLRIAYSKLPMALRNRKFGRPSFHAHSQAAAPPIVPAAPAETSNAIN